ncbi:DUF87 domain-containing protein [Riemerella anatipestifer]|nr:DUF87 domain-containing protein [Riemerella anatipestifer]
MENYIYGEQGSFVLGFRLKMPEKYSLGEEDYDNINSIFSKALRDLPTGSIFFKQDIFLEDRFSTQNFPARNFLEQKTKDYFNNLEYLSHTSNLFFILPNQSIELKTLKNPIRPPQKKGFVEFDTKIKSFIISVKQAIDFIKNSKLSGGKRFEIKPLDKGYMEQYYNYINGGLNADYNVDIRNDWEYLRVGNKYATVMMFSSEENFPENLATCRVDGDISNDKAKFFKNYGDNFSFDLGFTHIYNQIAVIDDSKHHYNQATKNYDNLNKFRKFDKRNEYWGKVTEKLVEEMAKNADTERIIRGHNNIVIFANSKEELQSRVNLVVGKFQDIDIKADRPYGDNLMALYEYSFPLNSHLFIDEHYYVSNLEVFSSFMCVAGHYNNDRKGIRLNSRFKEMTPVVVDVWDEEKKYMYARNFFILSHTGGGKSFMANHIISDYYSNGVKQVIIDLGGSYRKLATLFPNDIAYFTYQEGDNLGLNPFELKNGEALTTEKINELVEFIGVHFRREEAMTEQERAVLRRIVELYYNNIKTNHSLPSFINSFIIDKDAIIEHLDIKKEFFNADEFVLLMSEFVNGGAYSFLYDDTKSSFGADLYNKKIIVFELDSIRNNKLLLSIMLQLISTAIDKMIWQDKSTRGQVLFDEVAEQLKWDGMLRRIQWFYQAIRKQNGAVGIVLQSVSQLPNNELSNAIIENTQVLYVLGAKDYKAIQNRFNLSEHAFYQMSSIQSNFGEEVKRPYSEFFVLRGETHQVYRLEVPKEVWWAYQTEGAKNNLLLKIYDEVGVMEKAIDIMIEKTEAFEKLRERIPLLGLSEEEIVAEVQSLI